MDHPVWAADPGIEGPWGKPLGLRLKAHDPRYGPEGTPMVVSLGPLFHVWAWSMGRT